MWRRGQDARVSVRRKDAKPKGRWSWARRCEALMVSSSPPTTAAAPVSGVFTVSTAVVGARPLVRDSSVRQPGLAPFSALGRTSLGDHVVSAHCTICSRAAVPAHGLRRRQHARLPGVLLRRAQRRSGALLAEADEALVRKGSARHHTTVCSWSLPLLAAQPLPSLNPAGLSD